MSTSNGNTCNPSLDAGRPTTSGGGATTSTPTLEDHLIALHSALAVSFVALQHCPVELVGNGAAVDGREFFYTPEQRLRIDRLDWCDIEIITGAAARRVLSALGEVLEDGPQPQALEFAMAVERVTGTVLGLVYRFDSQSSQLGYRTVESLRSTIGVCLDAIRDLQAQLGELGVRAIPLRGSLN